MAVLHVECCLLPTSTAAEDAVRSAVAAYLGRLGSVVEHSAVSVADDAFLSANVEAIAIGGHGDDGRECIDMAKVELLIHVYQLDEEGSVEERAEGDKVPSAREWMLPSRELQGLWESLVYDGNIKSSLLDYIHTSLLFSDRGVDPNVISMNRVVLLHGPPGTGKTSLCKAIAQKLAIRLDHRFRVFQLLEINSHSLFSKWFSESGKLVLKMFQSVQALLDQPDCFVIVLIAAWARRSPDEVESLTAARQASLTGGEPSDAVRKSNPSETQVVNALLTQIDLLRRRRNVLVMATSNLTNAIDDAFLDRADIKQFIGLPTRLAVYQILRTCVHELMRVGIVTPASRLQVPLMERQVIEYLPVQASMNEAARRSLQLLAIAGQCQGMSGRAIRKIPFLAHAYFVQVPTCNLDTFLAALARAVDREQTSVRSLTRKAPEPPRDAGPPNATS